MTAAVYDLMDYDDVLEKYDPVMGMEVHVELATETKMFSASSAHFGAEPNSNVDPVSLGLPGALPVVNAKGVEWAIKIGLALNCSIAESSRFARKNYFYPDQPKNYQISQYDEPIAYDGYLDVVLDDGTEWRVEIERAHMEEDTGKLTHLGGADGRIHGATSSLVDCNRAGVPLIEIVTKPIEGAGESSTSEYEAEGLRCARMSLVGSVAGVTRVFDGDDLKVIPVADHSLLPCYEFLSDGIAVGVQACRPLS